MAPFINSVNRNFIQNHILILFCSLSLVPLDATYGDIVDGEFEVGNHHHPYHQYHLNYYPNLGNEIPKVPAAAAVSSADSSPSSSQSSPPPLIHARLNAKYLNKLFKRFSAFMQTPPWNHWTNRISSTTTKTSSSISETTTFKSIPDTTGAPPKKSEKAEGEKNENEITFAPQYISPELIANISEKAEINRFDDDDDDDDKYDDKEKEKKVEYRHQTGQSEEIEIANSNHVAAIANRRHTKNNHQNQNQNQNQNHNNNKTISVAPDGWINLSNQISVNLYDDQRVKPPYTSAPSVPSTTESPYSIWPVFTGTPVFAAVTTPTTTTAATPIPTTMPETTITTSMTTPTVPTTTTTTTTERTANDFDDTDDQQCKCVCRAPNPNSKLEIYDIGLDELKVRLLQAELLAASSEAQGENNSASSLRLGGIKFAETLDGLAEEDEVDDYDDIDELERIQRPTKHIPLEMIELSHRRPATRKPSLRSNSSSSGTSSSSSSSSSSASAEMHPLSMYHSSPSSLASNQNHVYHLGAAFPAQNPTIKKPASLSPSSPSSSSSSLSSSLSSPSSSSSSWWSWPSSANQQPHIYSISFTKPFGGVKAVAARLAQVGLPLLVTVALGTALIAQTEDMERMSQLDTKSNLDPSVNDPNLLSESLNHLNSPFLDLHHHHHQHHNQHDHRVEQNMIRPMIFTGNQAMKIRLDDQNHQQVSILQQQQQQHKNLPHAYYAYRTLPISNRIISPFVTRSSNQNSDRS